MVILMKYFFQHEKFYKSMAIENYIYNNYLNIYT